MNIFLNLWTNWTVYEKLATVLSWFLSVIFVLIYIRLKTHNTKFTLVSLISSILSILLTTLSYTILDLVFKVNITGIYLIAPVIITFINLTSLSTFIGYYIKNSDRKDFDHREHSTESVMDMTKLTIITTLFIAILSTFVSLELRIVLILSGIVSIAQLWINYYLSYKLVK